MIPCGSKSGLVLEMDWVWAKLLQVGLRQVRLNGLTCIGHGLCSRFNPIRIRYSLALTHSRSTRHVLTQLDPFPPLYEYP